MGPAAAARTQAKMMAAEIFIVSDGLKTMWRVGKEYEGWVEWKEKVVKGRRKKLKFCWGILLCGGL